MDLGIVLALFGAGLSVAGGSYGSSLGIGAAASSAAGVLSKDPTKFGQVLILSALPSTQSLFGVLFAFIVLIQTGVLSGEPKAVDVNTGLAFLAASIPIAFATAFSGVWQGKIASAGMKIVVEKPENLSQAIVLAALVETIAIFGFVVSLLTVFVGIKIA